MEVCPDTAGECCDRDAVETLSWYATVGKIRTEQECEMFRRRHEYEKSSMQRVISTTTSHQSKRDEDQLRVVTHEYADAMRVPEHYASTLRTRTLRSIISRMMSKCLARQLESCDALAATCSVLWFFTHFPRERDSDRGFSVRFFWNVPVFCAVWLDSGYTLLQGCVHARCYAGQAFGPDSAETCGGSTGAVLGGCSVREDT